LDRGLVFTIFNTVPYDSVHFMKSFLKPFALVFSVIFFMSCATIIKGTSQEVTINSNVPGALIELNGVEIGRTPFTGKIKKHKKEFLKVSKPGYITGDLWLNGEKHYTASSLGNAALGTVIGVPSYLALLEVSSTAGAATGGTFAAAIAFAMGTSTDGRNRAAWEYSPSSYYVQLQAEEQANSDFFNEVAIRYFATLNHSQIAIDAGKNNGEYAEALANLMETKMNGEAARQGINEALEESKGNQVMFGDALIERFRR
jgi:hypothetical protein